MKTLSRLVVAIFVIFYSCNTKPKVNIDEGIIINNVTIISGSENENILTEVTNVLIVQDTIAAIGDFSDFKVEKDSAINGEGKFLIPGLIDSHVHLGHAGIFSDDHYETKSQLVNLYFEQLPKSYLYFGFTSVIDLDLRERTKERFLKADTHPNLYSTGRGIRYLDGYGQSLFPKPLRYKIFPKWIYDNNQKDAIAKDVDLSKHSVPNAIRQSVDEGAIAIKTYYERGFGGAFNWPVPSDSLLTKLTTLSHAKNLPVILHATSLGGYKKGLKNDVDIFAYGLWHWPGEKLATTPPSELNTLYKELVQKNKYVQSTSRVILGEYDTYSHSLIENSNIKHVYPKTILNFLETEEGKWAKHKLEELYNEEKPDKTVSNEVYFEAMNDRVKNSIKLAYENKVKIILGSDTPAVEGIGNPPGLNGFLEIKNLSKSGVSLEEIFLASTIRNAIAFGLNEEIGSVSVGKRADLLLLSENPLKNIDAYNSIQTIILSGNLYDRKILSAVNQ